MSISPQSGAVRSRRRCNPSLLIETSRGCWWGAKAHCTFCGLNGATMNFRSKDADARARGARGLSHVAIRTTRVVAVDNILDMRYFRDLLPELRDRQLGITLFYETKANLTKEQVKLLRDAGVLAIQPGVESLSTHVLQLMRKGVTALQNIQLLKWCRQYGVSVAWNLLYGFPGETAADYAAIGDAIESLWHLPPPYAMGAVRMDRFSPYFNQAAAFGLVNVRPMDMYRLLYPLPQDRLRNLAYFFEFDHPDGRSAGRVPRGRRTPGRSVAEGRRRAVSRPSAAARRSWSSPTLVRTPSIAGSS